MSICINRITKELERIKKEPIEGFTLTNCDNIVVWEGILNGPSDTPYEKGKFKMQISFGENYPLKAPSVKFLQFIYHPNIYKDGKICVDILQPDGWTAAQNVRSIIISLRSLFMDPNPKSPANREAAELYIKSIDEYNIKVREYIL